MNSGWDGWIGSVIGALTSALVALWLLKRTTDEQRRLSKEALDESKRATDGQIENQRELAAQELAFQRELTERQLVDQREQLLSARTEERRAERSIRGISFAVQASQYLAEAVHVASSEYYTTRGQQEQYSDVEQKLMLCRGAIANMSAVFGPDSAPIRVGFYWLCAMMNRLCTQWLMQPQAADRKSEVRRQALVIIFDMTGYINTWLEAHNSGNDAGIREAVGQLSFQIGNYFTVLPPSAQQGWGRTLGWTEFADNEPPGDLLAMLPPSA